MAASWPEASFVGVDRSDVQVRDAVRIAEAAELRNVSFVAADFAEVPLDAGAFDFVLCHGVDPWVPVPSRQALLARIRAALAEAGVAYVSFNTLPGWYGRSAARDWMRLAARSSFAGGPREARRGSTGPSRRSSRHIARTWPPYARGCSPPTPPT